MDTAAAAAQTFLALLRISSAIPHVPGSRCSYLAPVRWNNQDRGPTGVLWDFTVLRNEGAEVCRSRPIAAEGQLLLWGCRAALLTFFKAKEAVWPPRTSLTGILLRWMDLTAIGRKLPRGSGPSSRVSFSLMRPLRVVPDTTVPTPCTEKETTAGRFTQLH